MFNKKRKNEIIDEELELEDYDGELFDLDRDEVFYSEEVDKIEDDNQDTDYTSFNSVIEYDSTEDDLYDKSLQEEKEITSTSKTTVKKTKKENNILNSPFVDFLMNYATIIKIVGIFLMIIVIAYYLSSGRFGALFLYLILLAVAYFIGFGCMYLYSVNKNTK